MALQNGVIAFLLQYQFYPVQISHFTTTKAPPDHIASTMLDRWCQALLQHLFILSASNKCSSLWSEHLKLRLVCPKLFSNLPLSSVCGILSILIFSFYWPVWDMDFSLQLCLEGQHPGVASSLLTLRLVFCGYYLTKLPVEDLSVSQTRHYNVLVLLLSCAPLFVSGHFELVIEPTNADAPDTQQV